MNPIEVAILMGSQTDLAVMQDTAKILEQFGVGYDMRVLSAHRTPQETADYARQAKAKGLKVFICGAGGSAALAGVVAAHTTLPVIGVPVDSTPLQGLDSLLSTAQMPPGVPVAAVAIGPMGAKNAALLALRILAVGNPALTEKLEQYREDQRQKILNTKL